MYEVESTPDIAADAQIYRTESLGSLIDQSVRSRHAAQTLQIFNFRKLRLRSVSRH